MGGIGSGGTRGNRSRTGMRKPKGSGTRPRIGTKGDKAVCFTFYVSGDKLQALGVIADTRRTTRADLVREAVDDWLDAHFSEQE
jgi:hypothetical protein